MSNIVYIGGRKGGSGKTTTAHLACLGAILRGQPAAYILTDPHRSLKHEGRPYSVMDGRDVNALAKIISSSHNIPNGWFVIDGEETALNSTGRSRLRPISPSCHSAIRRRIPT